MGQKSRMKDRGDSEENDGTGVGSEESNAEARNLAALRDVETLMGNVNALMHALGAVLRLFDAAARVLPAPSAAATARFEVFAPEAIEHEAVSHELDLI